MRNLIFICSLVGLSFCTQSCQTDIPEKEDDTICGLKMDSLNHTHADLMKCDYLKSVNLPDAFSPYLDSLFSNFLKTSFIPISPDTLQYLDSTLMFLADKKDVNSMNAKGLLHLYKANNLLGVVKFSQAIEELKSAEASFGSPNYEDLCSLSLLKQVYNLKGLAYMNLEDNANAVSYFDKYEYLEILLNNIAGVAIALSNKGLIHYHSGEASAALSNFEQAKCIMRNTLLTEHDSINFAWINNILGMSYGLQAQDFLDIGKTYHAEENNQNAIKQFEDNLIFAKDYLSHPAFKNYAIYTYSNLAYYTSNLKSPDYAKVDFFVKKCLEYSIKQDSVINPRVRSATYRSLAIAASKNGDNTKMLENINLAISSISSTTINGAITTDFKKEYFNYLMTKTHLLDLAAKEHPDSLHFLKKCNNTFKTAFAFLEERRKEFSSDRTIESLIKKNLPRLTKGIDIAARLATLEPKENHFQTAFERSERLKSYTLRQAIQRDIDKLSLEGKKKSLVDKEAYFRKTINELKSLLREKDKSGIKFQLADVQNQFSLFIEDLKNSKNSEEYAYFLERFSDDIPTLTNVRDDFLDKNTAILEMGLTSQECIILQITKDSICHHQIPLDSSFFVLLDDYSKSISGEKEFYQETAFKLYEKLFQKIKQGLPEHIQTLLIIPSGKLSDIRFEALLTQKENSDGFTDLAYLINDYDIVYHYSITSLLQHRKLEKLRSKAPYLYGGFITGEIIESSVNCGGVYLNHSADLTKKIGNTYFSNKSKMIFEDATKKDFIKSAADFSILQITAHGCEEEEDFYIQFSPKIKDSNNKLTKPELANLSLKADLVVLSSCNTARGKSGYGEGSMSMARTFAYGGAGAVTAAMSFVPDASSADLLNSYYKYLLVDNLSKAKSLANAKRDYIKKHNEHPWKWANLILLGDPKPLNLSFIK